MADRREADDATERVTRSLGYQPALDGVRAVAIILVMLFHFDLGHRRALQAGDLGVDAFFVLSGFLITTLLLQEHARSSRIRFLSFYARRALRLLPLVAVLVAFGLAVNIATHPEYVGRPQARGLFATTFYYANFMRIWHGDVALGMLAHTWSLAIEEQFYVVWPAVLGVLLLVRAPRSSLALVTGGGFVAVAAYRLIHWKHVLQWGHPVNAFNAAIVVRHRGHAFDVAYFGSVQRGSAILCGCFLAVVLSGRARDAVSKTTRWSLTVVAAVAVGVAGYVIYRAGHDTDFVVEWGYTLFALCTAAVIAALVVVPSGTLARLLGLPALVWIGLRSYGLYVIHYPVFVMTGQIHTGLNVWARIPLQFGLSLGLAAISFRFLEAPILKLRRHFRASGPPERSTTAVTSSATTPPRPPDAG